MSGSHDLTNERAMPTEFADDEVIITSTSRQMMPDLRQELYGRFHDLSTAQEDLKNSNLNVLNTLNQVVKDLHVAQELKHLPQAFTNLKKEQESQQRQNTFFKIECHRLSEAHGATNKILVDLSKAQGVSNRKLEDVQRNHQDLCKSLTAYTNQHQARHAEERKQDAPLRAALEARLAELEGKTLVTGSNVDQQIETFKRFCAALRTRIDELRTGTKELRTRIEELEMIVGRLNSKVVVQEVELKELKAASEGIEPIRRIEELEAIVGRLKSKVVIQGVELKELKAALKGIRPIGLE